MSKKEKVIMNDQDINRALKRIAHQIVEENKGVENLGLIGIVARGVPLAKRLAALIKKIEGVKVPVGALDVSLYRDDLRKKGKFIKVRKSEIPFLVTDKTVVFVDDVIFAGRTACAALDGLKDYGRPAKVQIASLIDRGYREMPIQADFVGRKIPTNKTENVQVQVVEIDGVDRVTIK